MSTGIDFEVLVVDDDSRDGTEELVSSLSREDSRFRILVRKDERGLAGAILHGWRHTDAGVLGVMDADGQHPPETLPDLIQQVGDGSDLSIGSRYARGSRIENLTVARRALSKVAVALAVPLLPASMSVRDPLSGFFLVRRTCIEGTSFQTSGFKLLLEILARGRVRSVGEVPIRFGSRNGGATKATLRVALDYLWLLLKLYGSAFRRELAFSQSSSSRG